MVLRVCITVVKGIIKLTTENREGVEPINTVREVSNLLSEDDEGVKERQEKKQKHRFYS